MLEKLDILISYLQHFDSCPIWLKKRAKIEVDEYWKLYEQMYNVQYEDGRSFLRLTESFKQHFINQDVSKEEIAAGMRRCNNLWKKMKELGYWI